jgi:hypothetical protein
MMSSSRKLAGGCVRACVHAGGRVCLRALCVEGGVGKWVGLRGVFARTFY